MKQKRFLCSIPLPIVDNIEKTIRNIDHESISNMKSLNRIINGYNEDFDDNIADNISTGKQSSVTSNPKLSMTIKPRSVIQNPMMMTQKITSHRQPKDTRLKYMTTSQAKNKMQRLIIQPKEEEEANKAIQSRNGHNVTDSSAFTHRKLISPIKPQNYKRIIYNKCIALYNTCNTFVSCINTSPKLSLKIKLKTSRETSSGFILRLLNEKKKGRNHRKEHISDGSKVIREANVISKISETIGYDSLNILRESLIRTHRLNHYSQANEINGYSVRRKKMVDRANSIMRKSQNKTRQCLKTWYDFQSKV